MKQSIQDRPVQDSLAELIDATKLSLCVECGKCVASCPMDEFYQKFSYAFSARGVIKKALLGLDMIKDENIWYCLACDTCAQLCPAGVKYAEFIEALRQLAVSQGETGNARMCEHCKRYFLPAPTLERLQAALAEKDFTGSEFTNLCPECRQDYSAEKLLFPPVLTAAGLTRHPPS